jgi:hypothetical protein
MAKKLEVFDPPMCCSTGICGPNVDPALSRFAADLQWIASQGVQVERYNLAQQPQAFVANPLVIKILDQDGNACLPLALLDNELLFKGRYPTRAELASYVGVPFNNTEFPILFTGCCGQ